MEELKEDLGFENPKGVHQKLFNIMCEIAYLTKDIKVTYTGKDGVERPQYNALTEEKVTKVVRNKLIKYKLYIYPINVKATYSNNLTETENTYKIVDLESGEAIEGMSYGQGKDSGDKGAGKASTYAWKIFQLRLLDIPTGEDPDLVHSDEVEDQIKWNKEAEELILSIEEEYARLRATPAQKVNTNQKIMKEPKLKDASINQLRDLLDYLKEQEARHAEDT